MNQTSNITENQLGLRTTKPIINISWRLRLAVPVFLLAVMAWSAYPDRPGTAVAVTPQPSLSSISSQQMQQQENGNSAATSRTPAFGHAAKPIPFNVAVVYSPGYLIDLGGLEEAHPFDIKKYQKIHNQLKSEGLLSDDQTFDPEAVTNEDLLLVHSQQYLDDLKQRAKIAQYLESAELFFVPVSLDRAVLAPFRRASGGTILAARLALETGIAVNIGGGYHHAKPDRGEGFCVYADIPISIRKLQNEGLIKRAVIVDVDVHQGNGTILCLVNDDTTFTFSMHQKNIYPDPREKGDLDVELDYALNDDEYMEVLNKHLSTVLDKSNANICFIVGGCDTLEGDPLASLKMTHAGIVRRDHAIVDACVKRNIPVVLTLAGGYSEGAWKAQYLSIKNLIETWKLSDVRPAAKKSQEAQESSTSDQQKKNKD